MKGMVLMKKIQLRLFDAKRNQNYWFHFCYIPEYIWGKYQSKFHVNNMDTTIKTWIKEDFELEVIRMEDIYEVKERIKKIYGQLHPDIFLEGDSDRQGWTRVWLCAKMKKLLEDN